LNSTLKASVIPNAFIKCYLAGFRISHFYTDVFSAGCDTYNIFTDVEFECIVVAVDILLLDNVGILGENSRIVYRDFLRAIIEIDVVLRLNELALLSDALFV